MNEICCYDENDQGELVQFFKDQQQIRDEVGCNLQNVKAGLCPEREVFKRLLDQLPGENLSSLIEKIKYHGKFDEQYFFCNANSVSRISRVLDKITGLSVDDRITFCLAPSSLNNKYLASALVEFAKKYSDGLNVHCKLRSPTHHARTTQDLFDLEIAYQAIQFWLYLSQKMDPKRFVRHDLTLEKYRRISDLFEQGLESVTQNQNQFQKQTMGEEEDDIVIDESLKYILGGVEKSNSDLLSSE
eukprot:TRINITY_DN20837_c0_g1_i2.p2 TRINITY_DN20837_c0_g1~~TRINITY_DN20837_c0_g1_i2.p2  ORF type:complete len:244 (-),score=31.69 TRINITY_DN20837_c0_g1_i2:10-741(-)